MKRINQLLNENGKKFITDGGIETTLIYKNGIDLPEFAAFTLLQHESGYKILRKYYVDYIREAKKHGCGFVLESATWRTSRGWGSKLGYDTHDLRQANIALVGLLKDLRREYEDVTTPMPISGCIGPMGDAYEKHGPADAGLAEQYHFEQVETLKQAGVDFVTAFTFTDTGEALGLVQAAQQAGVPVVIGFTVETDGRLPSGESLENAINKIDFSTRQYPAYYMINCAHPSHFNGVLDPKKQWVHRIRAVRANASNKSHDELDEMTTLDEGNPETLGRQYRQLKRLLPNLTVYGGCCGTDHRHIHEIIKAVA